MSALRIVALILVLAAAGCAGVPRDVKPPEVHLADIRPKASSGVLEQSMELVLNVRNPNDFDVPIDGLRFDLTLNGQHFATGLSDEETVIPRLGEKRVTATASTSMLAVIQQMMLAGQRGRLDYRMEGEAFLGGLGDRTVPFESEGEVRLSTQPPGVET